MPSLHQPLNRQSDEYAQEGVELPLSTLAEDVGACAAVLQPLVDLIRAHVLAGARVHLRRTFFVLAEIAAKARGGEPAVVSPLTLASAPATPSSVVMCEILKSGRGENWSLQGRAA